MEYHRCALYYCELKMLLARHTPMYVCFQETIRGHKFFFFNMREYESSSVMWHQTSELVGALLYFLETDIPPDVSHRTPLVAFSSLQPWRWRSAVYIYQILHGEQLPSIFLIIGDFKAHSPTLGCHRTNSVGLRTEDLLLNNVLVFSKHRRNHIFQCWKWHFIGYQSFSL